MAKKKAKEELVIINQAPARVRNKKLPPKKMAAMSFDAWWLRTQKKQNFEASMKEIVFKHFKSRGFLQTGDFDKGLIDFGVKS